MILDKDGRILELRNYDGELAHPAFYVYLAGVDAWLSTFRVARKHDTAPVIMSTGRRAYFENQLARHGFTTINGQIPTPIISFWLNDYQRLASFDRPREIKWFGNPDGSYYPDMIPFECFFTISFWARKKSDLRELESQFHASFNNGGIRWIEFKDQITGRRQQTPFFIENRTDASNYEPGETDEGMIRTDYNVKSEMHFPLNGTDIPAIKKVFININTSEKLNSCSISYISGQISSDGVKENEGEICGVISPGLIYFSGVVNENQADEEYILENHSWNVNPF